MEKGHGASEKGMALANLGMARHHAKRGERKRYYFAVEKKREKNLPDLLYTYISESTQQEIVEGH